MMLGRCVGCALVMLALIVSCAPNLDRESGRLEVRATAIPPDIETVRVTVMVDEARSISSVQPVDGQAIVVVETLPAKSAFVTAEILRAGVVLDRLENTVDVRPDITTTVALCFAPQGIGCGSADGGPTVDGGNALPVESSPISWTIGGANASDISGRDLNVETQGGGSAFAAFISDATGQLGRSPEWIEVTAVDLNLGTANGVSSLADLFSTIERVSLNGAVSEVIVASGAIAGGATQATLPIVAHDATVRALTAELIAGTFAIKVRGLTPRNDGDVFSADIGVSMTFLAH